MVHLLLVVGWAEHSARPSCLGQPHRLQGQLKNHSPQPLSRSACRTAAAPGCGTHLVHTRERYRLAPSAGATAATALRITSVTACGCEIMMACEPLSSVTCAPARRAIERTMSVPAPTSSVATTAQEGSVFQAIGPEVSANAAPAIGRWATAMSLVRSSGTSAA